MSLFVKGGLALLQISHGMLGDHLLKQDSVQAFVLPLGLRMVGATVRKDNAKLQ